jgi:hypothetical protein
VKQARALGIAAALWALAFCASPANAARVTVPGGTVVPVKVVDSISSATANVGDVFQVRAASDVVVDGWVVIPKDSPGQGEVAKVDRAGSHGHAGNLGLKLQWIYSADGGKIRLSSVNHSAQGSEKKGASSTATIGGVLLLGPLGLFAHNFVHGHDVTLDASRTLTVYVDSSVHVSAKHRVNAGFDQ